MKPELDFIVFADGGSRGNPGEAAYGFVIYDSNGSKIYEEGKLLGIQTNNFAEYSAVIAALKWLSQSSIINHQSLIINVFLDSKLVAMQLSNRWKIKNEILRSLYWTIKELEKKLNAKFLYSNIPREQNKEADLLVNLALDAKP